LFLSNHGLVRWLAAAVAIAAPVSVVVLYISRQLLWAVLLVVLLGAISAAAGRAAIVRARPSPGMPERATLPPYRPFMIMNPRSGGGKVGKFQLDTKAAAHGVDVALIEGPGDVDVAGLARQAVTGGADLLGVAGGDGTQALVAGIAAEHGLPFVVISAGTRNHFALDLGLDRERPDAGLEALTDGVELRLDLGLIGGRTFVNNASFGAYAEVVQSPAYRDDKRATTLQMLPDLLSGARGPRLVVRIDNLVTIEAPQALLVSNNPYELGDLAGLGRRARLDTGVLGVIAVTVDSAAQAVELLRGRRANGIRRLVAHEVVVDADAAEIPVGIDGEAVMMTTPVRCSIRPLALRVRVPRERPGVPAPAPQIDRTLLLRLALSMQHLAHAGERSDGQRSRR
jgi:diacylglycerol kinase family enzyme